MEMAYLFIGIAILIVIIVFFTMFPIGLWIEALASGVHVSLFSMFGMRLRRCEPAVGRGHAGGACKAQRACSSAGRLQKAPAREPAARAASS